MSTRAWSAVITCLVVITLVLGSGAFVTYEMAREASSQVDRMQEQSADWIREAPPAIDSKAVLQQLDRMLKSRHFRNSRRTRRSLPTLCAAKSNSILSATVMCRNSE